MDARIELRKVIKGIISEAFNVDYILDKISSQGIDSLSNH